MNRIGTLFDLAYLALMTNVLLAVAVLPVFLSPWLLGFAAPGLCAAFAVFGAYPGPVVRTFVRAWLRSCRRALPLGALATAVVVVLGVDIRAAWEHPAGAVVIPVLVVLIGLVVATAVLALVAIAGRPDARLRDVLRAGVFGGVRRWYLTVPSLGVLVLWEALYVAAPVPAVSLAASPLLYVVWANSRWTLSPHSPVPTRPGGPAPGQSIRDRGAGRAACGRAAGVDDARRSAEPATQP
ncbi:hypothetical protein GCM10010168_56800 [Actinoplanes ianthinogenes]|uniref:Membrane protein YesL n=1 Tax=Actinoplanes ianthinogenes TaxID=122358 RepID=A0ABN6CLK6_9ACTN|nr:ferredoxin-NADPH reductase [Actinoplanes ianthinogenes]BCJ45900.1 hypothetical protein Aiant_65570 [Actinoplanes ianthinogenes]GGR31263.1 hypothetical protein GCM10010168_56800 [Actinoplanes ianthinogenes]